MAFLTQANQFPQVPYYAYPVMQDPTSELPVYNAGNAESTYAAPVPEPQPEPTHEKVEVTTTINGGRGSV
jgi:hypothetical protein